MAVEALRCRAFSHRDHFDSHDEDNGYLLVVCLEDNAKIDELIQEELAAML